MCKIAFIFSFLALFTPCFSMTKASSKAPIVIESDNNDEYGAPYWIGPGMYWGMYISNENDYWRHYDERYPRRPVNKEKKKSAESNAENNR